MGPNAGRSWLSAINAITAGDPDLSSLDMTLVTDVVPTFTFNWIIRGHGTGGDGKKVNLR